MQKSGTRKAALLEEKNFLTEIGVPPDQYNFEDGSGLSRLTLVTPETIMRLLSFMYASPNRDVWVGLLPIASEDGTLSKRFKSVRAATAVHAKTGTLSHVTALSGYVLPETGPRYAFSIVVNNFNAPATEIRNVLDKIIGLLL
jgi:D-alanyl-D-alanine carboxypeptidase/D-alanyl-D-alanine-endopeptidase (penicillin-binding protein 4)